jgi:hypothetical protein
MTEDAQNEIPEAQDESCDTGKKSEATKNMGKDIPDAEDIPNTEDRHELLLDDMQEYRERLADKHQLKCALFVALPSDSDNPVVVMHGDLLDYTKLSVVTARHLRQRIINQIDGQ